MTWRTLTLVVLLSALSFGGSFECRSGDRDRDDDDGGGGTMRVTTP